MNSIERWFAPGILVGIALIQFGQAQFGVLSPWKGGGFGMFASVDSPGTRTIACEGVSTSGETVRIDPLAGLNPDTVNGWRALPRHGVLRRLGSGLLAMRFTPAAADSGDAGPIFYRPLLPGDPGPPAGEIVELDAIRLRWWRVAFDFHGKRLAAEPIGAPVELHRAQP